MTDTVSFDAGAPTPPPPADQTLIDNIEALLDLDAAGALVPHGIGGLARTLFERVIERLKV